MGGWRGGKRAADVAPVEARGVMQRVPITVWEADLGGHAVQCEACCLQRLRRPQQGRLGLRMYS